MGIQTFVRPKDNVGGIAVPADAPSTANTIRPTPHTAPLYYRAIKRLLDIIGSVVAIILFSLPMLLTAIAVKLTSRGPLFFTQTRLGKDGQPFTLVKFRSMIVGSEDVRESLLQDNELDGPVFKIRKDPRLTPIGGFIRKFSLDEMPQIFSVLRGHMSLVGPRPPIPDEVAHYEPWQTERLAVKPGLTCIWQVSGRSDIGFEQWVKLDIDYVRSRSILLDLKLLLLTIPAVLTGRGAY
ncbi:MAG: sugar transferase [Armatimonadota bacterium]